MMKLALLFCFLFCFIVFKSEAQLFGFFGSPRPWYESVGLYGIWRCGDWRSKFRIIDCSNGQQFPVVDFPPGYDIASLQNAPSRWTNIGFGLRGRFGGGPSTVRILGIPVSGFPDVFRDSDYPRDRS